MSLFVAMHCAIQCVDHITELNKRSFQLSDLKMHQTKCSEVIKTVMYQHFQELLINHIGDIWYSVLLLYSVLFKEQSVSRCVSYLVQNCKFLFLLLLLLLPLFFLADFAANQRILKAISAEIRVTELATLHLTAKRGPKEWPATPLQCRGNVVTSHTAGPGQIPCGVNFLVEVFPGFPSTVRQMSGNLGHI